MPSVRPRHHEVTRIEGFSDAVFGFALTLLVVSLEPPKTNEELRQLVQGSLPFALMFAMVCWIWWEHNKFFRRYGLQDAWTGFLNCVLLFVVLFYVYPLKFLTTALFGQWFGWSGVPALTDGPFVMMVYSAGVVLIFSLLALLDQHAWRKRRELGLSTVEEVSLRSARRSHLLSAAIGVASVVLAAIIPDGPLFQFSGLVYGLMGPAHFWNGYKTGKAIDAVLNPKPKDPPPQAEPPAETEPLE